jgi:hypothetical protein
MVKRDSFQNIYLRPFGTVVQAKTAFEKEAKKMRSSEVFDSERAPPFVLVTRQATETLSLNGYNLPIASTNLKLLT